MSLSRVISDTVSANPEARPEMISEAVVRAIELSLPEILEGVKAPLTPSRFTLRRRELRRDRVPKRMRNLIEKQAVEEEAISRELAYLQRALDGTSSTISTGWYPSSDWNLRQPKIAGINGTSSVLSRITGVDFPERLPNIPLRLGPFPTYSIVGASGRETHLTFTVDPTAQARLAFDAAFLHFVSTIESATRAFAESYRLAWGFEISLPTDMEEPSWGKITMRLRPTKLTFGEKTELWDRIDAALRKAIETALTTANPEEAKTLKELNRNFFVELDLSE